MNKYSLTAENVTQTFGRRLIFKDINFSFTSGRIYGLTGSNGSGKSTLAKILSGIISQTRGKVIHQFGDKKIEPEKLHEYLGFVSPYLVLYDEFTAEENLRVISKIRGNNFDEAKAEYLLNEFNLYDRRNDLLKTYSSGMKQRIKFMFALIHSPKLLILDEPTSNLDEAGKAKTYGVIRSIADETLIIIASNEKSDLELCGEKINVEDFKNNL